MKYIVDRIIDNIAVCEIYGTTSMIEIDLSKIDFKVQEGDVLLYKDGKYFEDKKEKRIILNEVQEQLNRLKNLQ